jgi:RNA ligase (TIGR02306 family)
VQRKLASIQRIESIEPIAGADRIVKARVMGWDVVVKKDELQPGDLCVFFEIDSLLPEGREWAEFLRPRGFRVKTATLRGVLSQGLALPLSILDPGQREIGDEVTEELGVKKYDPPLPESLDVAGPFPGQIPKTDEIRLQSALGVLEEIAGRDFYITTKCDGTSATFFNDGGTLRVCSRNWELARTNNTAWRIADQLDLAKRLPAGFAIQGELCGPGIQKNRLGLSAVSLFVFSAHDTLAGKYLGFDEFGKFAATAGLTTVPIERVVRGEDARAFSHTLENYLALARGIYAGTKNRKEGIVIRPLEEAHSSTLAGRLSFKVINNEFLLKDED